MGQKGDWRHVQVTGGSPKWRTFYDPKWVARFSFATNGVLEIHARRDAPLAVGWRAPCSGTFTVSASLRAGVGGGQLQAALLSGSDRLWERALAPRQRATIAPTPVDLKEGDFIYLSNDCNGAWGLDTIFVEDLRIEKTSKIRKSSDSLREDAYDKQT